MVVNKLFVTLVSRLRTQKYKRRHLFCSGSAQRNQRAGSFLWSLYHFLFTSMLVRLHSWVSANQPSPLAHWSKSMSWMLTSTRITPLTQKHTHIHKHTHRRGFTETDVRQCNETRVAPNVTRLIRMITFFFFLQKSACLTLFQLSDFVQLCWLKYIFYSKCLSNMSPECWREGNRGRWNINTAAVGFKALIFFSVFSDSQGLSEILSWFLLCFTTN